MPWGKLFLWILSLFGFGKPDPVKLGEQVEDGKEATEIIHEVEAVHRADAAPISNSVRTATYRD